MGLRLRVVVVNVYRARSSGLQNVRDFMLAVQEQFKDPLEEERGEN